VPSAELPAAVLPLVLPHGVMAASVLALVRAGGVML
jgi:hypothetical protein